MNHVLQPLALVLAALLAPEERPYPLMVGDPAPRLEASRWLRGDPIETFAPGKVYVLDFFATWCGPCKEAMPAISALNTKHGDRASFVAFDVWDYQDRVPAMVAKMGDALNYAVALDRLPPVPAALDNLPMWARDHGATSRNWLVASGVDGIPALFVVDGKGRVAWIGHEPAELDKVLGAVLAGSWDVGAAAKEHASRMKIIVEGRKLEAKLRSAEGAKDLEAYVRAADELVAFDPLYHHYAGTRFQTTLLERKRKDEALEYARGQLATNTAHSAFGQMAYVIVFMATPAKDDLDLAEKLALRAEELSKGERPGPASTLAKIAFLRSDKAKAVEWQTKAVARTTGVEARREAEKALVEYGG
jgi:thiol-disulfide isomerase/thioredoxin